MYEFHSLTLAGVPIMWTVYCFITKKRWQYWVALAVALLVREDVPLMLTALGFAGFMSADAATRRRGLSTILVCAAYFVVVKTFFMTSKGVLMQGGAESYSFSYYYADMIPNGKGVGGMSTSWKTAYWVSRAQPENGRDVAGRGSSGYGDATQRPVSQ